MKKLLLVILFLFAGRCIHAQTDSTRVKDNNPESRFFAIKAKILPWLLGNRGGLNITLGAEQSFFTHHSAAIEGYFYGIQDHYDNYSSNDTVDRSQHHYSRDRALSLTYRYYFTEDLRAARGLSFYLGITGRYGKKVATWDEGFREESAIREVRNYTSAGPIAGLVIRCDEGLNLDIYAGTVFTTKTLTSTYPDLGVESGQLHSWDLRLGINLSWWFGW